MFSQIGWGEFAVLTILALFIFGPERLPRMASDAAKMIRRLRSMANDMTADLKSELGPGFEDLDVRSLHPREFARKALMDSGLDDAVNDRPAAPARRTAPRAEGAAAPYDSDAT